MEYRIFPGNQTHIWWKSGFVWKAILRSVSSIADDNDDDDGGPKNRPRGKLTTLKIPRPICHKSHFETLHREYQLKGSLNALFGHEKEVLVIK